MLDSLVQFDKKLLLLINGFHTPTLDAVMEFASGKLTWLPLYLLFLYVIFRKYSWNGFYVLLTIVILITLCDQVSASVLKPLIARPRPCHVDDLRPFLHLVNNHCGGKYGFVSSHSANAFGLATFLSFLYKKPKWSVGLFLWAALVGYSRIYLGVHYPGDVLGGAILGILSGIFVYLLLRSILPVFRN